MQSSIHPPIYTYIYIWGMRFSLMVISRAFHLYDPGWNPRLRTQAEISRSQSDSEDFSPGTPVFLTLQIRLSRQDLSRRAFKHQPVARKNGQPLPSKLTLNKVLVLFVSQKLKVENYVNKNNVLNNYNNLQGKINKELKKYNECTGKWIITRFSQKEFEIYEDVQIFFLSDSSIEFQTCTVAGLVTWQFLVSIPGHLACMRVLSCSVFNN